jgi:acylphosphatase
MEKAVSITVSGRVQQVGYRHYTRLAAQDYDIKGKIENKADGSVYIEAQGEEKTCKSLLIFARRVQCGLVSTISIFNLSM